MALCCCMPTEVTAADLLKLELITADELDQTGLKRAAKRLTKEGFVQRYRAGTGKFTLQQKTGGECVFLDDKRRCTVYDKRPQTCHEFPQVSARPEFCPATPIYKS